MNRELRKEIKNDSKGRIAKTYVVIATDDAVRDGHAPATFEVLAYDLNEAVNKTAIIAKSVSEKICPPPTSPKTSMKSKKHICASSNGRSDLWVKNFEFRGN